VATRLLVGVDHLLLGLLPRWWLLADLLLLVLVGWRCRCVGCLVSELFDVWWCLFLAAAVLPWASVLVGLVEFGLPPARIVVSRGLGCCGFWCEWLG
jgi:hypothetical protein